MTVPMDGQMVNMHILILGTLPTFEGNAVLHVCARDRYMLWTDGVYMGQEPVPCYLGMAYFDSYVISGGQAVTVGLHVYCQGLENRVWYGSKKPEFWFSVNRNGSEIQLGADIWKYRVLKAYSGATVGYDTQFSEDFDGRLCYLTSKIQKIDKQNTKNPVRNAIN